MSVIFHNIYEFINKYFSIPKIFISDIVEIVLISIAVYYMLVWLKNSKAWVLIRGLVLLVIFMLIASLFHLTTILWIINKALNVGIIAVVIIFQPELRRALEALGKRNKIFTLIKFNNNNNEDERFSDQTLQSIKKATLEMAKYKTGALIVIKKDYDLEQFSETGIRLEAKLTSQLLINIFEKNTPLHDGAVIIEGDVIVAATCYLPLSESLSISKELGTRHRAALGLSEVSDCLVIVVSEETGSISVAKDGRLVRFLDGADLEEELEKIQDKIKPEDLEKGSDSNEE